MNESKIQAAINLKIINVVKWIMEQDKLTEAAAFEKLLMMELYCLLTDAGTGLYLEPIEYIDECCRIEREHGKEALIQYVSVV